MGAALVSGSHVEVAVTGARRIDQPDPIAKTDPGAGGARDDSDPQTLHPSSLFNPGAAMEWCRWKQCCGR